MLSIGAERSIGEQTRSMEYWRFAQYRVSFLFGAEDYEDHYGDAE